MAPGVIFVTAPYIRIALAEEHGRLFLGYFGARLKITFAIVPDSPLPPGGDPELARFVFCMPEVEDFLEFWTVAVVEALYDSTGRPLSVGGRKGMGQRALRVLRRLVQLEEGGHITFYRLPREACLTAVTLYGADAESAEGSRCSAMLYPGALQHYPVPEPFLSGWRWLYREVISERLAGVERMRLSDHTERIIKTIRERLSETAQCFYLIKVQ